MNRYLRLVMLVATLASFILPAQALHADPGNGCTLPGLATPGPPVYADFASCSYTATGRGIYSAHGTPWCIDVSRNSVLVERICGNGNPHAGYLDSQNGDVVLVYLASMPSGCASFNNAPYCSAVINAYDQR